MGRDIDLVDLVKRAQFGDKECLDSLAEAAEERLRLNVYRLTMEHDLTEEIVQETMLKMLKVLNELKEADRFWPWLYRIALNKIHLHHRKGRHGKTVPLSAVADTGTQEDRQDAMAEIISRELKDVVTKAMRQLKPAHRTVLTLRCYEEMEYAQIGEAMGRSEFAAQMLFARAKRALKKQLARRGFGKGSLLMALALFGRMTASSEAAAAQVSVTAATTKVGVAAGSVSILASRATMVSLVVAGVLGVGTIVATPEHDGTTGLSAQKNQGASQIAGQVGRRDKVAEEYWYFFPEGTDGPVMMRLMESVSKDKGYYCRQMQDDEANYHFDRRKNTIYINNHRLWHSDLSAWQLPTDDVKLREFISQLEGRSEGIEYVTSDEPGLMAVVKRSGNASSLWTTHHYHVLKEEYFQHNWPGEAKVIDNRDAMHKRGWTYFTITGRINGKKITGTGRIPFVYATSEEYSYWLRLNIGHQLQIVDSVQGAAVYKGRGDVLATYPAGSFFKGLARPWMGLHTIDTVRRDAAEQKVPFETDYNADENKAEVVLTSEQGKLVYTIDMEKDVVEEITISTGQGTEGELRFSYLQDIDEAGDEFVEPRVRRSYGSVQRPSPGMLWLTELVIEAQRAGTEAEE
jgi:RNA polymerase sigma-70 factor (ECF subfamily)